MRVICSGGGLDVEGEVIGGEDFDLITIFAKGNKLATIVGEKTAGGLLSASSVKVGNGFRLALPTGAYYTWRTEPPLKEVRSNRMRWKTWTCCKNLVEGESFQGIAVIGQNEVLDVQLLGS
jgi:hypothetical protein